MDEGLRAWLRRAQGARGFIVFRVALSLGTSCTDPKIGPFCTSLSEHLDVKERVLPYIALNRVRPGSVNPIGVTCSMSMTSGTPFMIS